MPTSRKNWATVLCVALGCQGGACGAEVLAPPPAHAPGPHQLVTSGVEVQRWVAGRLRLSARAEQATVDRRRGTVVAAQVTAVALDEAGAVRGELAGRALTADLGGERVVLTGDVALLDPEGRTVTATHAIYTARDQRVRAPGRVLFEGSNFRAEGRGLTADLEAGTVELDGAVGARIWR